MPLNLQNFIVDPLPVTDEGAFDRLGQTLERGREWQYRMQQQKESEQYRKANLIQELTDLSQHQTGSDVANAVGNKLMSDVYQKYTANADKMSPLELQAGIQKDMSGIVTGMEGAKNELSQLDNQIKALKQVYPDLDTGTLYSQARQDIVHRRLNDNGTGFRNQMEVPPSQFDLTNPDLLSKYVTTDKNLRTYFSNPQGLDQTDIFTGNRTNYTKFSAKIPPWKQPNFNPEDVQGGFLTKGEPKLNFKSEILPSDAMPSSKGHPFEMINKDVFDQLGGKEKLELIAATRRKFLNYDNLNDTEKEYAQRHTYLQAAKSLDQLDFHPTEIKTPSASMLKLQMGIGGSGASNNTEIKDAYSEIHSKVYDAERKTNKLPLNELTAGTQGIVLSYANKLTGGDLTQEDIYVAPAQNGQLSIFRTEDNRLIAPIDFGTINVPAQTNAKSKQKVIEQANKQNIGGKMVTVTLSDGRQGQIPEKNVGAFLKENPGSKRQ